MHFSKLGSHFAAPPNALYAERDRLQREGLPIVDLVSGQVQRHGLVFPQEILRDALVKGVERARIYEPHPLGQLAAREVISSFYQAERLTISPENILITPGTSLAYAYALRALADEGDEILCPQPSYPLFESIAAFTGVRLTGYPLRRTAQRWALDASAIEECITPKTRAIILISPHNPTGHVASESEIKALVALAARRSLPVIADEVFSPFIFSGTRLYRPASHGEALVLTLNGFSKLFALPGLKFGWMAATGPAPQVRRLMQTLEHLSDTFLPVSEAVQFAAPFIFSEGGPFLRGYQDAMAQRMEIVDHYFGVLKRWRYAKPEGGFYVSLELPEGIEEEAYCLQLLQKHRLLLHPGFFYDFETPHIVLSFASAPEELNRCLPLIDFNLDGR
jgi:alanine-synthesizing transaminase